MIYSANQIKALPTSLRGADNFLLRDFMGHRFNYNGNIYQGSTINSFHVGMQIRANGIPNLFASVITRGWNIGEAIIGDDLLFENQSFKNFKHQMRQSFTAPIFAQMGADHWDNYGR